MQGFNNEIKNGFTEYLIEKGKITKDEAFQEFEMSDELNIFLYSSYFKDFLVKENYADSDIYSKSITDIENMEFVGGKFIDRAKDNDELSEDNLAPKIEENPEIDNIFPDENFLAEQTQDDNSLIPETDIENPFASNPDEAEEAQEISETDLFENLSELFNPEVTQREEETGKVYQNCEDLLDDIYLDEDVLQYLDENGDGKLDEMEKLLFEEFVQGDDEEMSLDKLQEVYDSMKDNTFDIDEFNKFKETLDGITDVDDVKDEIDNAEKSNAETKKSTPKNVSRSNGGGGGSYGGGSSSATSKPKQKTLKDMSESELNAEKTKAQKSLSTEQEKLSSIMDGSDKTLSTLKENSDNAYNTLYKALEKQSPDLAKELDSIVQKIASQEAQIDAKEIQISQQQVAESQAKTAYSNAKSTRDAIKNSISTLKDQNRDSSLTPEQKTIIEEKLSEAESKLEDAEKAVTEAEENMQRQQDALDNLEKELELLSGDDGLGALKLEKEGIDERISAISEEMAGYKDDYNAQKDKYDMQKAKSVSKAKADILNAQKRINEVDTAINELHNKSLQKELKFSKTGDIFDNDIDIGSEYVKHDGVMPYLVVGPEPPDPNVEYPVLLYLHGAGEFGNDEGTLRGASLQYALINGELRNGQDIDLAKFNGYVIFPQANSTNWTDPNKVPELVKVLDDFSSTHNVDMEHIALSGHSMGGTGAQYMAHEFEVNDYGYKFCKVAVISGYDVAKAHIDQLKTPMRGYVGVDDSAYMKNYFRSVVGNENVFVVNSDHGSAPEYSYILDSNGNGISDMFEWLFSDD